MNGTLNFTTDDDEDNDVEIEVNIEWEGHPGSPAVFSGPPDNWEPADGGYFDINKITLEKDVSDAKLKKGDEIEVEQVRETEKAIEEDVINSINDDAHDEPEYEPDDHGYDVYFGGMR